MPEGPEVRRQCDALQAALGGRVVTEVWFAFERLKRYEAALVGGVVYRVEPRGKAFLVRFEGGMNVYAHHNLYGRWMVRNAGRRAKTRRQLRAVIENAEKAALLYSASEIDVLADGMLGDHPYLSRLGPDVLGDGMSAARVEGLLSEAGGRRGLAGLYLDQGFLAGVGNYMRSETLWLAGLAPGRAVGSLSDEERGRLAEATVEVARRAYEQKGVTVSAEEAAAGKASGRPRRAWRHYVFGRAGRACPRCGGVVEKRVMAGRRVYVCEGCQG